ncbi:MAG: beta-N-acetylhexosaminidase [Myxococcota bacterium]|jgi:beta-N-acetylhexosaminidase|nr:beta-N-acetylhexosaminidase [Myxococcota bacterium]
MTGDEALGAALSVIVAGFDGTTAPPSLLEDVRRGLGGVVLFARNVEAPAQVAALLEQCRASAGPRPFVAAVDQEGGRVVRLREPLTVLPPARSFGLLDTPSLTEAAGRLVGAELCALGFSANFAPVLDVDTNSCSPIIGDRSYGSSPQAVLRHGLGFARGLRDGGVHPVAKHFPGHGDASLDSHLDLPRVEQDEARLEAVELMPFSAYARSGMGGMMTAHVVYPALDTEVPATLSRAIVTGILRERLHFRGPVLSDDLEMGAISRYGSPEQAAVLAIDAGVDGLLICRSETVRAAVVEALQKKAQTTPAFAYRLERAASRLCSLASPLRASPKLSFIGSSLHLSRQQQLIRALATGQTH